VLQSFTRSILFLPGYVYLMLEPSCRLPSLATMSGGDGMVSALEYMLSATRGLLWPRSVVTGA
jgi:hypothetical protein